MADKFTKWEDFEKELNITAEQEAEIRLEMDLIEATIEARKKCNLSQRELSEISGIKQPAIARIEKQSHSPQVATLMRLLYSMGYTLRVVPLDEVKWIKRDNKNRELHFRVLYFCVYYSDTYNIDFIFIELQ